MSRASHYGLLFCVALASAAFAGPAEGVVRKNFSGDPDSCYALYVPPGVEEGKRYPLIVVLHGSHGNVDAPIRWWRDIASQRNCFVCAPKSHGMSWPLADQSHVTRIVAEIERDFPIDPKRVLLTGVSDGGTYSYVLGFKHPDVFSAIAVVSGILPLFFQKNLDEQPKLPICIVHGTADDVFPFDAVRKTIASLKEAHYNVTYFEIARGGHGWFPGKAADILDWFEGLSGAPDPQKQKAQQLRRRVEAFHGAELLRDFARMAAIIRTHASGEVTAADVARRWGRYRQLTGEVQSVEASGDTATVKVFNRYGPPFEDQQTGARNEKWVWIKDDWFLEWTP